MNYSKVLTSREARGGVVVKALRYKPAGRGFDQSAFSRAGGRLCSRVALSSAVVCFLFRAEYVLRSSGVPAARTSATAER